jgi:hypothetical protein
MLGFLTVFSQLAIFMINNDNNNNNNDIFVLQHLAYYCTYLRPNSVCNVFKTKINKHSEYI